MLTSKGKSVLAKYLVNQAPGYAGYIAVGSGAPPLSNITFYVNAASLTSNVITFRTNATHNLVAGQSIFVDGVDRAYDGSYTIASVPNTTAFTVNLTADNSSATLVSNGTVTKNYKDKETLDFEMFRVPIISRAMVVEDGTTKLVFSAELPSNERYGISEIGIYPSGSNPVASGIDSRVLFSFSDTEKWEYHADVSEAPVSHITGLGNSITGDMDAFAGEYAIVGLASDPIFDVDTRKVRNEQPRFETNTILIRGNTSVVNTASTTSPWTIDSLPNADNMSHIHHTDVSFNFDKNSSSDKLKLAFSIIPVTANSTALSDISLRSIVQFSASENVSNNEYANMQIELTAPAVSTSVDGSRYFVATANLSDLKKTSNFNWSEVDTVKVYMSVQKFISTISNTSLTNNIATITTAAAHGLQVDDLTVIVNHPVPEYNGAYAILSVPNTTSFTVAKTAANIASNAVTGAYVRQLRGDYWVALDGLRFENTTSAEANPLYGLTGYSTMSQSAANLPIIKESNTNNILEFKFSVDTGGA